ncbi:MAG: tetratricopeptide repeat protein [candidate division FCPU426 bacterium]
MDKEEKKIIVKVAYNYVQQGKLDRALEEYKKLVAIDPMDFLVHSMMAEIYVKKGDKDQAVGEFLKAGSLLRATNNFEKAVHAYNHILKLDPSHAEASSKIDEIVRTRLVEIDDLLRRGLNSNANEMCERLLQRLPQHPVLEAKLKEIEQAGSAKAKSPASPVEEQRTNAEMLSNLMLMAKQYEAQESWEEAVEAYITVLRLQPKNEEAQEKLREIYRHLSRKEKSQVVWDRISAERQKSVEQAKLIAKTQEKPQTESAVSRLMNRIAQESAPQPKAQPTQDLDRLRQQAEEKLRLAVQDRRERERQKIQPSEEPVSRRAEAEGESNVQLLLTQAQMYVQQNLLADAMRLAQNILEQDPQNKDVRGILLQIFQKKNI